MTYIGTLDIINEKLLDYELVSIEDYTIKGRIPRRLYRRVVNQMLLADEADMSGNSRDKALTKRFKNYLIEQIEQNLQDQGLSRE